MPLKLYKNYIKKCSAKKKLTKKRQTSIRIFEKQFFLQFMYDIFVVKVYKIIARTLKNILKFTIGILFEYYTVIMQWLP